MAKGVFVSVQLPGRVSRLEGAYEQVADRLNGIGARLSALDQKIDEKATAFFNLILGQTAVILGAIAAAAFALHH